jgi:hypothetical protein
MVEALRFSVEQKKFTESQVIAQAQKSLSVLQKFADAEEMPVEKWVTKYFHPPKRPNSDEDDH